MTVYFSGSETTERESLLDTVAIRYPAETPLLRTLPSTTLDRRIVEYPIDRPFQASDNVRSPSAPNTNTRAEGASWVVDGSDFPVKLRAICEINHFSKQISNSDLPAILAGVTNTFDYRVHQTFVKLLNNIETVLMYGAGSPETSGSAADERNAQGLIYWAGWTGLERIHGNGVPTTMSDPYGISIPSDYWSVFFNAQGSNLSRQMLYNRLLASFARAGGHVDGLLFHVGFKLKNLIADYGTRPDGSDVNKRNVPADALMTYDDIDWIRTSLGIIGFRTNRYLDIEGSTYTIDPSGASYTPGSPSPAGTVTSQTFQADETMVGFEPGQVAVGWYRAPQYEMVPTTGDFKQFACVAEYTLVVRHPLCVLGAGNLIG
jgi:hypothetical protein